MSIAQDIERNRRAFERRLTGSNALARPASSPAAESLPTSPRPAARIESVGYGRAEQSGVPVREVEGVRSNAGAVPVLPPGREEIADRMIWRLEADARLSPQDLSGEE